MASSFAELFEEAPRDEGADLYEHYRRLNQDAAFRSARQRTKRFERLFEQGDIPLPSGDETKGFIGELFDTLDTGGQFVRGGLAKALGVEGFEDETFLGAAMKGTEDDLIVGDILRDKDILQGEGIGTSIARGATGFLGDVITDPITWLTAGAGGMGRQALGKATAGKKLITNITDELAGKLGKTEGTVDEILEAYRKNFAEPKLAKVEADYAEGLYPSKKAYQFEKDKIGSAAEEKVTQGLAGAVSVVKDARKLKRHKPSQVFDNVKHQENLFKITERDAQIKQMFGLGKDVDLEDFFLKSGVRFSSPFAGMVSESVPILGQRAGDIPLLTPASIAAGEFLNGAFYNLAAGVGGGLATKAGKEGFTASLARGALSGADVLKSAGKLVSRRLQLGGKVQKQIIDEADRAKAGASGLAARQANAAFGMDDWTDAELELMTNVYDAGRTHHLADGGKAARRAKDVIFDERNYNRKMNEVVADLNAEIPGKGDKFKKQIEYVRKVYDDFREINVNDGNYEEVLEGYLNLSMKDKQTGKLLPFDFAKGAVVRYGKQPFMKHRELLSVDDAIVKGHGYIPEKNMKELFRTRVEAQIKGEANKKFHERLGFEVALDPETYMKLNVAAMSQNAKVRANAAKLLEHKGFKFSDLFWTRPRDVEDAIKKFQPITDVQGKKVSRQQYDEVVREYLHGQDNMARGIDSGTAESLAAIEKARTWKDGNLNPIDIKAETILHVGPGDDLGGKVLTPAQHKKVRAQAALRKKLKDDDDLFTQWINPETAEKGLFKFMRDPDTGEILQPEHYQDLVRVSRERMEDRRGPGLGALVPTPSAVKAQEKLKALGIWKTAQTNPEQLLPELQGARKVLDETSGQMIWMGRKGEKEFERAGLETVNEKFAQFSSKHLTDEEQAFYGGLLPRSMTEAIAESLETKDVLGRMVEKGAKADAMSKHLSNLTAPYLGWVRMHKMLSTIVWPGYLVRNFGSAQFQSVQNASLIGESMNLVRLKQTYDVARKNGHFIQEGTRLKLPWSQLRQEMKGLDLDVDPRHFLELAEGQTEALTFWGTGKVGKKLTEGWRKWTGFTAKVENFGRHNLYINLRRQGMAPSEAADVMNKAMVDYSRGKTKFEKSWLNNTIFFYSFARGQASNTFHQMIHRPGALTAQLHAIDGVKEILTNGNTDLAPDIVGEIETLRSKETVSRYLGTNEEGTHQLLTGVGLPAEDLSRFLNIHLPTEWTLGSFMDAGDMTARRTVQTAAGAVNPLVKGMVEYLATNRSMFFDQPLDAKMMRRFPHWEGGLSKLISYPHDSIPEKVAESVDEGLMKVLGGRTNGDGTMTINPAMMAVFSYLLPGAGRAVSTANFLNKKGPTPGQKLLRAVTGIKVTDIDPESSRVFERANRLENELMQRYGTKSKRKIKQLSLIKAGQREEEE